VKASATHRYEFPKKILTIYQIVGLRTLLGKAQETTVKVFREKEEITMKKTSLWVLLFLTLFSACATTPVLADGRPVPTCTPDNPCPRAQ